MSEALIVEDDEMCREAVSSLVKHIGFNVHVAETMQSARTMVEQIKPRLALVDLGLPDGDGLRLVDHLANEIDPSPAVFVITGDLDLDRAVLAMQLGAADYLTKPIDVGKLRAKLEELQKEHQKANGSETPPPRSRRRSNSYKSNGKFFIASPAMLEISRMIDRVANTDASVLVMGETGVGKEVIAEAIHERSPRAKAPFVPINSGAVSPNLIESQLFGHEKGSFTGAHAQHPGFFEQAEGGTLFLDEITEMAPDLQIKLLRVLESRMITRVGSTKPIPVNVRIVAATNRDPRTAIEEGKLRHDLYFRLNVFPITVPPLRQRQVEVQGMAEMFLKEMNKSNNTDKKLSKEAVERLTSYHWPGNVRELKNVVQRAWILTDGNTISGDTINQLVTGTTEAPRKTDITTLVGKSVREVERDLIEATLAAYGGDKPRAAEVLGFSLKTLYNRLNEMKEMKKAEEEAGEEEKAGAGKS